MPKSLWTGQESSGLISIGVAYENKEVFVEPEHRTQLESYLNSAKKWKPLFLGFVFGWSLVIILLALMGPPGSVGLALLILSAFLLMFPYPTPQTIRFIGVRKSMLLVRFLALIIAGFGIGIMI